MFIWKSRDGRHQKFWVGGGGTWQEAHTHRARDLALGRTEIQVFKGQQAKWNQEKTKWSSSKQARQTSRKNDSIQHILSHSPTPTPTPLKWGNWQGCLGNFRPIEDCSGNCNGAIWVAPKLWCSGKKREERQRPQVLAELGRLALISSPRTNWAGNQGKPTCIWIPAPPPLLSLNSLLVGG